MIEIEDDGQIKEWYHETSLSNNGGIAVIEV